MERAWSLCELGKGGLLVIHPCLTEDAEAQRGEATCLRTHRGAVGLSPPGCARRPPAELPALAPHPPGQARILHPFRPEHGAGVLEAVELICPAVLGRRLRRPGRLRREQEFANALIISSSTAMALVGDQEAGSVFACCFITF